MNFKRIQTIEGSIRPKRVLIIYGPRRVGKTTLLKAYLDHQAREGRKTFYGTGDDFRLRELFQKGIKDAILDFARPYDVVAIDEAQQIPGIGRGAKILIDFFPEKSIILTGSSSFDLSQEVEDPLTGRHFTMTLLPIAQREFGASRFELDGVLEDTLLYGSYPEVLRQSDPKERIRILTELVSSYLFKDVLALEKVRKPDALMDVVRCIALQVGSEVSVHEIAVTIGREVKTVARYLDLLEKMFVIKRVRGYSRNLRNEISKKAKYYFLDNGVRNAVIGQFGELSSRTDVGALWENFVFMELYKITGITDTLGTYYFWRTHTGQEIDIVRETGATLEAIECKWKHKTISAPKLWRDTYPHATYQLVSRENYLDILLPKDPQQELSGI
jgi:uncharacterized protein